MARSTWRWLGLLLALFIGVFLLFSACGKSTSTGTSTPTSTPTTSPTTAPIVTPTPNKGSAPPEVTQYASDWPLPNRDYSQTRATNDSSINSTNVNNLGVAWSFAIPGIGAYGGGTSNPIIMGNTVFFQDGKANVFALDLQTGAVKWQKLYNTDKVEGPNGPAVGYGKVFVAKDLYTMAALDMNTGQELWSNRLSNVATTGIDIQPSVYDGLVYVSTVPGTGDIFYAPGGMGVIYALDEKTGEIKWQFNTVYPDDLWGHPEVNSGGGAWYSPAVDINTGMTFWGIGNPAPFPGTQDWPNGSSRPGPNLYTDSMVVLNHENGKLEWFTQVLPHDLLDHDFQISPILTTVSVSGGEPQEIVIGAGKMGNVYAFNRKTGTILWMTAVGEHNQTKELDVLPPGTTTVLPGILGGVETPMALGDNGVLYVPVVDLPSDWTPTTFDASTVDFSKGKGELVAIDVNTGNILWHKLFGSLNVGAATVVNDLVFTATYDGMIYAFNRDTGEQVWSYQAPAGINGWPAVTGDTIVWPVGVGGTPSLLALKLGATSPMIKIVSPTNGSSVPEGDVTVSVQVLNFNLVDKLSQANIPGEGHIHYFIDADPPTTPGKPAVTNAGTYAATAATSYTWHNVAAGSRKFSVELVNNDHTPLVPPVVDSITITVTGGGGTPTPTATPTLTPTSTPQSVTINLTAKNIAFDKNTITVPAGAHVIMTFDNQDTGISHNFALYTNQSAQQSIFIGQIVTGPTTITYTFDAPTEPGTYFYRCDVHPTRMTGQFIVQ
jgi:outer membrane protein assembly factor BamB/plastocyanin